MSMTGKKCLGSQAKATIAKVYHHIKKEKETGIINLTDAMWRTAQAVGFSECLITSILSEKQEDSECTSTDTTEETTTTTTNDINSQTKEIIARVYHHMKIEAEIENVRYLKNVKSPSRRTAQAVGYSQRTVFKILKEEQLACANTSFMAQDITSIFKPPSKRKRVCPKSTMDNYDLSLLRKTIISYQTKNHEMPTLKELKEIVSEKTGFNGCKETLRKILYDSGFEWSTADNHKLLVERHDIQMLRFRYLKELQKYRDEGRYIVFTDNYYVETSTQKKKKKENGTSKGVIIIHAGGSQGFVPNACLIYETDSASDDSLNFNNYKQWLTKQLLPNLPENTAIVMNNENCVFENCPDPNSSKSFMHVWLTERNIDYEETMNKVELYDLILKGKGTFKSHSIEELVRSKGFQVLRLPPHHPDLNPMEHIWRELKKDVALKNVEQELTSNLNLIKERIEMIESSLWEYACRQGVDAEHQYMKYFDDRL
ncbi:uncharacterized protein LOC134800200 isoform X1 [Cydia splendana]|uniref:uncharacterized protein LOC134800200 isoform X1 n=1 Tax=Cydia splendana TaxID=1100963 RepID=UPI00300DADAE